MGEGPADKYRRGAKLDKTDVETRAGENLYRFGEFREEGCLVLEMREENLTYVIDEGGKMDFFLPFIELH
jgi:hypothetical protein